MVDKSAQISGDSATAQGSGPIGDRLRRWGLGPGKMSPEERRKILEQLYFPPQGKEFRQYLRRFVVLLSAAVLIAWCGLRANSTAVVIGAMLVAPLMEPILAMQDNEEGDGTKATAIAIGWIMRNGRITDLLAGLCLIFVLASRSMSFAPVRSDCRLCPALSSLSCIVQFHLTGNTGRARW